VKTLRELAIRLFKVSPPPSARLSFVLGVRQRAAQYWLSGQHETPPDAIELIENQIQAVEGMDLEGRIQSVIDDAAKAGVHPSVTAHFLAMAVDRLKDPSTGS
jgi:hypothetical protein